MGQPALPGTAAQFSPHPGNLEQAVGMLAHAYQLGAFRQVFAPHKRWRVVIATGVLALIGVLLGGGLAVAAAADPANNGGAGQVISGVFIAIVPLGLFIWVLFTSPLFSARLRERQIYLFEHGYVRVTRQGPLAFRWDGVRAVYSEIVTMYYNGISTGTQYRYKIMFADGRVEKLNTYVTDMATFGPIVQAETARVQVPQARQMLRAGHSLAFADLVLSGAGLVAGNKGFVPWPQVRAVQIFQGQVRILKHGKRMPVASTPAKRIPNLYTFLTLAEESVPK